MKKIILTCAVVVATFAYAQAQTPAKPADKAKTVPAAAVTAPVSSAKSDVVEVAKPADAEAASSSKKECTPDEKKACAPGSKAKKSCCSHKKAEAKAAE